MRSKLTTVAVVLGTILTGSVPVWGVEHCAGYAAGESENFEINPGQCVIIQGIRNKCDKMGAPTFARIIASPRVVSTHPKNGTLSDGGIGSRDSQSCGGDVDVRIIVYTPNPGFVGEDYVEFFSDEAITITVKPSN